MAFYLSAGWKQPFFLNYSANVLSPTYCVPGLLLESLTQAMGNITERVRPVPVLWRLPQLWWTHLLSSPPASSRWWALNHIIFIAPGPTIWEPCIVLLLIVSAESLSTGTFSLAVPCWCHSLIPVLTSLCPTPLSIAFSHLPSTSQLPWWIAETTSLCCQDSSVENGRDLGLA